MKRIALGFLVVMLFCPAVNATGIQILSEIHHVWGNAGEDSYPGEKLEQYDFVSRQPVYGSASGAYYWMYPDSLEASYSNAFAGNFQIELNAGRWSADAFAESTYVFVSEFNNLIVSAFGGADQTHMADSVSLSLVDLTTGSDVFRYSFNAYLSQSIVNIFPIYSFNFTESLSIDPGHLYQLSLYGEATRGDSPANSYLVCDILSQPIAMPESGTGMMLFIGLLALSKKRRL